MAEQEVRSPVSRPGSKVGIWPTHHLELSAVHQLDAPTFPARPSYGATRHSAEPGEIKITGPEE